MISVKENYELINDLLSKNNGVFISLQEYGRYATLASNDLFDTLRGNKNQNRAVYGKNRTLDSRLNPFRVSEDITFTASTAAKPEDLEQILAIYDSTFIPVKPIDEDRLAQLMQHPLRKPNEEDKYYIERVDSLKLLGATTLTGTIEYLKRPQEIVYGYTIVGRRPVHDEATSVNFEWDKNMETEIINRILGYMGLSMKDSFTTQVSNNNKSQE